jgi:hypothetical protein
MPRRMSVLDRRAPGRIATLAAFGFADRPNRLSPSHLYGEVDLERDDQFRTHPPPLPGYWRLVGEAKVVAELATDSSWSSPLP